MRSGRWGASTAARRRLGLGRGRDRGKSHRRMGGRSAIPPRRRPADARIAMFPLPCGRVRRGFVRRQNQPGLTACTCANRDRRRRVTRGCAIRGRGRRSLLALPWPRELLRRWRRRGSHPALLRGRAGARLRSASDGAGPSGLGVLYRPPAPRQLCLRPSVAGMGVSVEPRAMIGPARLALTLATLARRRRQGCTAPLLAAARVRERP
jgi:hypothetical protein